MSREVSPIHRWQKGETLRLGIVVDLPLTAPSASRTWPEHLYAHLADEGARQGTLVCLFNPGAVDWRLGRVSGWVKTTVKGRWERKVLPLPHVVYNRISRRDVEGSRACRRALARLAQAAPLFNPRYLDKGEVQQALESSPVAPHVPPTWIVRDVDELMERIGGLPAAFIKPVRGSLGEGIARVECRGKSYIWVQNPPLSAGSTAPVSRRISRAQLKKTLRRLAATSALVLQQAVELPRWRGLPFDLRLLVQKDEAGGWQLTGAAGRAAAPGALTTHTVRGGLRVPYTRLAREASAPLPTLEALEEVCRPAADAIQQAVGEECFEFSFDVAVSESGDPWILEANAKPFPFDEPDIRRAAARKLLAYAAARAGVKAAIRDRIEALEPSSADPRRRLTPAKDGPTQAALIPTDARCRGDAMRRRFDNAGRVPKEDTPCG